MGKSRVLILNAREHQKKKRSVLWIILVMLLLSAGAYFLLREQQQQASIQNIRLFYYDFINQELVPVQREFQVSGTREKAIKTIVEQLAIPPNDAKLISLIPAYTKVKAIDFSQNTCIITFQDPSVSELADSVVKESAAVYSLINTICEFPEIQKVKIIIEGKTDGFFNRYYSIEEPLMRLSGQLMRGMNTLLYFYHYPSDSIIGEFREIPERDNLDKASLHVVNQLLLGTNQREMNSLLPQGTKVLNAKVENGICTVNFSKEVRRFSLGASEELALINILTLSLTELNGIERIHILIEGKEVYTIGGHVSIEKPLNRWHGTESSSIKLYYLKKFQHISGFVPIDRNLNSKQPEAIVQALIEGTTAQEKEAGFSTDIPSGIKLLACYPNEKNELIVDLEIELSKFLNAQQEQNFIRQIVLSLTENTGFKEIRFYFEGKKLESLPFGTEISRAFSRTDSFR